MHTFMHHTYIHVSYTHTCMYQDKFGKHHVRFAWWGQLCIAHVFVHAHTHTHMRVRTSHEVWLRRDDTVMTILHFRVTIYVCMHVSTYGYTPPTKYDCAEIRTPPSADLLQCDRSVCRRGPTLCMAMRSLSRWCVGTEWGTRRGRLGPRRRCPGAWWVRAAACCVICAHAWVWGYLGCVHGTMSIQHIHALNMHVWVHSLTWHAWQHSGVAAWACVCVYIYIYIYIYIQCTHMLEVFSRFADLLLQCFWRRRWCAHGVLIQQLDQSLVQ
jgi:hypothetical protein